MTLGDQGRTGFASRSFWPQGIRSGERWLRKPHSRAAIFTFFAWLKPLNPNGRSAAIPRWGRSLDPASSEFLTRGDTPPVDNPPKARQGSMAGCQLGMGEFRWGSVAM